jgi:hypothetical protein
MGRGSRMSMRYDLGSRAGDEEGGGSGKNTLKGMFKNKNKKSKQIELDALRYAVEHELGGTLGMTLVQQQRTVYMRAATVACATWQQRP